MRCARYATRLRRTGEHAEAYFEGFDRLSFPIGLAGKQAKVYGSLSLLFHREGAVFFEPKQRVVHVSRLGPG